MLISAAGLGGAGDGEGQCRTEFLGLNFDPLSLPETTGALSRRPVGATFAYLVTPNVDHLVRLAKAGRDEPRIAEAYQSAAFCVCDSRILAALARLRGVKLRVVPGSDLTRSVLAEVVMAGDTVAIVGSDQPAVAALRSRYPGVNFIQHIPPMGIRSNEIAMEAAANFMVDAGARFLFVAIGSPQQELVAKMAYDLKRGQGVALCIGAAIDLIVGREKRAPYILQRAGLEWAFRLLQNPKRLWRRYLIDGPRIFLMAAKWRRGRPG